VPKDQAVAQGEEGVRPLATHGREDGREIARTAEFHRVDAYAPRPGGHLGLLPIDDLRLLLGVQEHREPGELGHPLLEQCEPAGAEP
jgi:hypothetical protein